MKKGKYLIFGLLPLTVSATLLNTSGGASGGDATRPTGADANNARSVSDANGINDEQDVVEQLILKNADPAEVIGILEQLTNRTALVEQKLPTTKISIEIREPISRQDAIDAVESLLGLNGVATIYVGDKFMKVVPSKSAVTQSPDILDESLLAFDSTQRVFSKFFRLNYADAAEFQKLIKSFLTPNSSSSTVFPFANACCVTDTMANLQTIENLIKYTDTPIKMTESVNFLPLSNVKASAVAKKFEQLKRGALKKYLNNTTVDFDDSSNQLIIITHQENFSTIADIAKQLDNKCELLLRSEVIRIKHGDAKKITDIVSGIIKEQRSHIEKENKMAFERQQAQMTAQGSLANALAQAASGSRGNQQISNTYSDFITSQQIPGGELGEEQIAQFSANLTLSSDERSNSIIVYGTASDLLQVKNLVTHLDVLLDQVRIEVIVAQITLNEGQQSGLDSLNLGHNQAESYAPFSGEGHAPIAHDINFSAKFGEAGSLGSFTGTLKRFALNSIFQKAKTDSNIKILSTPTLVTTHNRKANFKIGEDRPFVDSSTQSDSKDAKERVSITYKHVGLELTVTPLIGNNGIIQMEIDQKISKYDGDATAGSVQAPIISDKQINSFVSVGNGDVIVLAGFKEKENSKSGGKVFLLGDLPLIGDALFTSRKRDEKVKELIVFIKPTIILHPQEEAAYLDKRLEVTNFKEDIALYKATGDFPKSDPFPRDTILGLNAYEMDQKNKQRKKEKAMVAQNKQKPTVSQLRHHKEEDVDAHFVPVDTAMPEVIQSDDQANGRNNQRRRRRLATHRRPQKAAVDAHFVPADTFNGSGIIPLDEPEVFADIAPEADEASFMETFASDFPAFAPEPEVDFENEGLQNESIVENNPTIEVESSPRTLKNRNRRRH